MISIATMGKFIGVPTIKASAKYGGGTSAGTQYIDTHKFPTINIHKINKEQKNININILEIKEDNND